MDTTTIQGGGATATEYATTGLVNFIISLILMFIFLALIMEIVRYFTSKAEKKIIPKSTDNSCVWVTTSRVPGWLFFTLQTISIIAVIYLLRGAFNMSVKLTIANSDGKLAIAESLAAFGFLALGYKYAGPLIARKFTFGIIKSKIFKSEKIGGGEIQLGDEKIPAVVTEDEYLAMGNDNP
jgi:hypothetical protein